MKDQKLRTATFLIIAALSCSSLIGCGDSKKDESTQESTSGQATTTPTVDEQESSNSDISAYLTQIEYYESLIATLEEKLLEAKEESFITNAEYKQQINELQESIAALNDRLDNDQTNAIPEETSNNIYNEEKNPSTEQLSSRSAFAHTDVGGKLTITGYTGNSSQITLPSKIDGKAVTAIGEAAFKEGGYERITIPDGVKEIGWFAFSGCTRLCEISIPSSVTSIGYGAFDLCPESIIIKCKKGSYAEAYAKSWGFLTVNE